jgi:hypothetical protein
VNLSAFCITALLVVVTICFAFIAGVTKAQKDKILDEEDTSDSRMDCRWCGRRRRRVGNRESPQGNE